MYYPAFPFKIPDVITKITCRQTRDGAPANSYFDGELILAPSFWKLPVNTQHFIICHEAGHIALQTRDELKADAWGFDEYVKSNGSLRALVDALADVLSFKSIEHLTRTKAMFERCAQYDLIKNNNKMVSSISLNNNGTSFLGGWTPLANLQTAFENRQDRKDQKTDAKTEKIKLAAQAKLERAENGSTIGDAANKYTSGLTDLGGKLFGGNTPASSASTDAPKSNTTTIVLVVVGVVLLGVAAYFFLRKK